MTAIAHRSSEPSPSPDTAAEGSGRENGHPRLRLIRLNETPAPGAATAPVRRFADVAPWVAPSAEPQETPGAAARDDGERGTAAQPTTSTLVAEHIRRTRERQRTDEAESERRARRSEALREEQRHVAQVVRLVGQSTFEVLAGVRPLVQLSRWLDAPTFERLQQRLEIVFGQPVNPRMPAASLRPAPATARSGPNAPRGATRPTQTPVQRLRVCRVAAQTYEASVIVNVGGRLRAAAVRLERRRGQWKVCALELG